ncbi:MAG: TIGR03032 family protein [Pseudomonadota bacterium]
MSVDVFISYARVDREAADRIGTALQAVELDVWWDALLLPGDTFDEKIQTIVSEAKVFVGVLSPTSLLSDWVRWELSQAVANGLHVVPILIDGVEPEALAPPLSLVHAIVIPEFDAAVLQESVVQIQAAVGALARRDPGHNTEDRDARRRLAIAATETASRADEIKQRNRRAIDTDRPEPDAGYSASAGLAELLAARQISLAVTTPDWGWLSLVGSRSDGALSIVNAGFDEPTGMHWSNERLVVATRTALITLTSVLQPGQSYGGGFSHLLIPRESHFLGLLAPHDVAVADGVYFVSSRYSCVATPSPTHSFRLAWLPSFVSAVAPEDRCHLNGLAVQDGELAFATAFGVSDSIDGWRENRVGGGVVLDLRSGGVVCEGLTMPHSPRVHGGRTWVLNSGTGELGFVRMSTSGMGAFEAIAAVPGFARGLAFDGPFAFCGVSRPRYEDFAGLELHDRLAANGQEAHTGVVVIDTRTGECVERLWLEAGARETYDVSVLPGVRSPTLLAADSTEAHGLITMDL